MEILKSLVKPQVWVTLALMLMLSLGMLAVTQLSDQGGDNSPVGTVYAGDHDDDNASGPQLVETSSQKVGSRYVEVNGYMTGTINREDGSTATYKVPATVLYPTNPALCNGMAIEDVLNTVMYGTHSIAGTPEDPLVI